MLKITDGTNVFEVTGGAYESIYKRKGFYPVEEAKVIQSEDLEAEDELIEEVKAEITEKPLSQWSKDEMKAYIAENNIDVEGVTKVPEIKERIKAFMDSNM